MITEGVGTSLAPAQLFTQNWPDIDGFSMHELSSFFPFSSRPDPTARVLYSRHIT